MTYERIPFEGGSGLIATLNRMIDQIFEYNQLFTVFGQQHLAMIALTLALAVLLPAAARRFTPARQLLLARILSLTLSSTVIIWTGIRIYLGDFDRSSDLPLDICNLSALLLPVIMWRPTRRVHELLYFWILSGTLQAVITPYLYNGFPNFTFIKYWIVHGGLIVYAIYITAVFRFYPDRRSIWNAFLGLQIYTVILFGLNWLLGSNYFYIMHKPPTASLLDYFGPWPWYLIVCEFLALLIFWLVYLPLHPLRSRPGVSADSS